MEKKSIKKNYIYNVSYQILLLLTPLITIPYLSRVLGADGVGIVSYAESIVSYFTLFATMGITTYGQREISYLQDSIENRSIVFWNTKILSFIISGMTLTIYLGFSMFQTNSIIYVILAFNILAVGVDVTWFFQGMEEFGKIVFRNVIFKIINVGYVFLVVRSKDDVVLYVFGLAAFLFLSNISLWTYIPKYVQKVEKKDIHPFKDLKIILSLFLPTVAIQIYTVLDKTMIGIITQNAFENGYYEQALKLSKTILTVVTALGTVMIPRIGYHFQRKNIEEVKRLVYRSYRFVWFLGVPLCLGLIFTANNFVPWFFGLGYEKVTSLLVVLALLIPVIGISNVTGMQYLLPTKRQNIYTLTVITGAVINFVLNLLLIRLYQSLGAAIASVIAESAITVVQLYIVRKELSVFRVFKEGNNYFVAGAVMTIGLYFAEKILAPTILHTIFLVTGGAIIYFSLLLVMKDEFFLSNLKIVLKKVKGISR